MQENLNSIVLPEDCAVAPQNNEELQEKDNCEYRGSDSKLDGRAFVVRLVYRSCAIYTSMNEFLLHTI